jgi:hypothetical protein
VSSPGAWELLPTLVVRSAGFPWQMVDGLSQPAAAAAAERLASALDRADALRATLPAGARWTRGQAARLRNYRPLPADTAVAAPWRAEWDAAAAAVAAAREEWLAATAADEEAVERAVTTLAGDSRVREAIACSGPGVYRDLAGGRRLTGRLRRQVAAYTQRLATKCETMSFFGPINYGRVDSTLEVAAQLAWKGPDALAGRTAFLAAWAFDGLLESVLAEPGVTARLVPRRAAFSRSPSGDPPVVALVAAADGVRTLAELAEATGQTVDDAAAALQRAVRRGLLTHQLVPPAVEPDHARWLAARLAPGAGAMRTAAVVRLLDRYPDAGAGSKAALQHELTHLVTPEAPARESGAGAPAAPGRKFYNDRVVVTEAAVGTLELTVGAGLARDLRTAVPAALDLLARAAAATRRRANAELAAALGSGRFPLLRVLRDDPLALVEHASPVLELATAMHRAGPDAAEIDLAGLDVAGLDVAGLDVAGLDDPGRRGAPAAPDLPVLCSADVMVAVDDLNRYRAGQTLLVVGDVHDAALLTPWALQFHPEGERLLAERDRAVERCLGPHRAVSVVARRSTGLPPLRFPGAVVELGPVDGPAERLSLDRLVVQSDGERAALRVADVPGGGRSGVDLYLHNGELDSGVHTALALPRVRPLPVPDLPHVPRVRLGNVVLARRRWRLLPGLLSQLPSAPSSADGWLALRRASRAHGLPSRFFAKASHQRKPIYVDMDSPLLVEALYRLAAGAERVQASEVLPDVDGLWLRDGAPGRGSLAVAAEFRCVYLRAVGSPDSGRAVVSGGHR